MIEFELNGKRFNIPHEVYIEITKMKYVVKAAIDWQSCNMGESEFEDENNLTDAVKNYLGV